MSDEPLRFRDREHFVEVSVMAARAEHEARVTSQQKGQRQRRQRLRRAVEDALPNTIGTIVGGAVLALGAAASGLIHHLGPAEVGVLLAVVTLPLFVVWLWDPPPPPFDEGGARRHAEQTYARWRRVGLIVHDEPED